MILDTSRLVPSSSSKGSVAIVLSIGFFFIVLNTYQNVNSKGFISDIIILPVHAAVHVAQSDSFGSSIIPTERFLAKNQEIDFIEAHVYSDSVQILKIKLVT